MNIQFQQDWAQQEPGRVVCVHSGAGLSVGEAGQATALVVDAEVTSILMMGALSPGLKRHSVTLFEGSRLLKTTCVVCNPPCFACHEYSVSTQACADAPGAVNANLGCDCHQLWLYGTSFSHAL